MENCEIILGLFTWYRSCVKLVMALMNVTSHICVSIIRSNVIYHKNPIDLVTGNFLLWVITLLIDLSSDIKPSGLFQPKLTGQVVVFANSPKQSHNYIAADWCSQRDTVTVMFSVLLYSTFTVQLLYKLYSLPLKCTYSNYTEAAAICSACYHRAHLLYKYCTVCNWTVLTVITQKLLLYVQRVTVQHIYCTNTVQTVQSATELYLQ